MKLRAECAIAAPRESVWALVSDVERAARCIEGVEEIRAAAGDHYEGRIRVKLGVISLAFEGAVAVEELAREDWRGALRAHAKDVRQGGRFDARLEFRLAERGVGETDLGVELDVTLFGRLGELGQPLIRKKVGALLDGFAQRVAAELAQQPAPPGPE